MTAYTPPRGIVVPGDWFVTDPSGGEEAFDWIERGERLAEWAQHVGDKRWHPDKHEGWYRWGHAGVATRWADHAGDLPRGLHISEGKITGIPAETGMSAATVYASPVLMIAEAEPGGAVEVPWHWENVPHMWSTATDLAGTPTMGAAARRYTQPGPWGQHGVPYAFPDYGAIAAKALHLPWPGLDAYMASALHMICSQLVDQAAQDTGLHLFDDGRPPGYVMPLDLALLLAARGAPVNTPPKAVHRG